MSRVPSRYLTRGSWRSRGSICEPRNGSAPRWDSSRSGARVEKLSSEMWTRKARPRRRACARAMCFLTGTVRSRRATWSAGPTHKRRAAWCARAQAGLRSGDVLLNWNGSEPPRNVERWAYAQKAGSMVRARVRREDREISVEFRIDEVNETFYQVVEDPSAGAKAKRIREGMLRGVTQPVTALLR